MEDRYTLCFVSKRSGTVVSYRNVWVKRNLAKIGEVVNVDGEDGWKIERTGKTQFKKSIDEFN